MAPKGKKDASQKQRNTEEDVEEPLQAVILADSFENRFGPLTLERPRCLLPLANTPLIEYTFEFLANAGVEQVFVYSGAHSEQVEEYVQNSKWNSATSPFDRVEILHSSSSSIGDAMRDLDARAILANDFLIVYGDIIANLPLDSALAAHRARRAKDKNAIMTMVLREVGTNHRTKSQESHPVFVLDPTKDRCVHYEQMRPQQERDNRFVKLDPETLKEHEEVEFRQDLIDCGIDICTPDVLALWSDNFDYEYPRRGFLHSVLKDYELNGKTIHTHIVADHYAARVRDIRAYDAVSKDVLGRWAYPLCPDTNLVRDQTYRLLKGNVYKEEGVVLARSSQIGSKTVVGRATSVGEGSVIRNSVIGRRVIIGRNVKIDGAYIWDDATVGDGTIVQDAIIANEASVGKRCKVLPGAVLSYGVHVSDNTTIKEGSRITRMVKRKRGLDPDEIVRGENDAGLVGKGGSGFKYRPDEDDESDDFVGLGPNTLYNMANLSLSQESISTLNSEEDYSEGHSIARSARSASFGSIGSVASDDDVDTKAAVDFHHDAAASIYDSLQKGDESANIQLELTALRMTADASPSQVRRAVVAAFMKRIAGLIEEGSSIPQAVQKTIRVHKILLERTMFDRGDKYDDKPDQVEFLLLIQSDLCHRQDGESIMVFASNELAMNDIVDTEGFEQWWGDEKSVTSEELVQVRGKMQPFMDAILDDSEEESSEGEEEDEEEDEDEEEGGEESSDEE